jgi:hypothetical protein
MTTYEEQLNRNRSWAFHQGSLHFECASAVHETARRIVAKLKELQIPYAVIGAMAMFFHGYRRFTEDIDIVHYLVDSDFSFRDAATGVRIDIFLTDHLQTDHDIPQNLLLLEDATCEQDGFALLKLEYLIELKLLSGMRPARLRDLADAQAMLDILKLPRAFGDRFQPVARSKYRELWDIVQNHPEIE